MYNDEKGFSEIIAWFTASEIVIAALGLFGLSAYLLEKRKREFAMTTINRCGIYKGLFNNEL